MEWALMSTTTAIQYPVTFRNVGSSEALEARGLRSLERHRKAFSAFMEAEEKGQEEVEEFGSFYEYGLSFDNLLEEEGYYRYRLSWVGPSSEVRFYGSSGRIEFVYLDWFCGIGFDVTHDEVFRWLRSRFKGMGLL